MTNPSRTTSMRKGDRIVGKWNKQVYHVHHLLGEGANGQVYLVQHDDSFYALKVGFDPLDLQSEINVLRTLDQRVYRQTPYLIDVDDFLTRHRHYPFYVMKYVQGRRIHDFIQQKGKDWFFVVGKNLLMKLAQLHTAGWQFGDIKTDNILVGAYGQTELVDYGGVTEHGHSVKQFTEMYDRGYWRCGARIADETYDLFSFAVLCIQLILPKNRAKEAFTVSPKQRNIGYLQQLLAEDKTLLPFHPFIIAALEGRFGSGAEALQAWKLIRWKNHEQRIVTKSGSPFRFVQALFISIMLCVLTMMFVFQY